MSYQLVSPLVKHPSYLVTAEIFIVSHREIGEPGYYARTRDGRSLYSHSHDGVFTETPEAERVCMSHGRSHCVMWISAEPKPDNRQVIHCLAMRRESKHYYAMARSTDGDLYWYDTSEKPAIWRSGARESTWRDHHGEYVRGKFTIKIG